jgi:predicted nucleotidyltransferase
VSNETFHPRKILRALARHGVVYVVVGGVAVQAHGGQRLTQDLDLAVPSDRENYDRLASALSEVDARILGLEGQRSAASPSAGMLASGDLWHLDSDHGMVDVIVLPAALGPFEAVRERAHDVELGDVVVPVAAREDLIAMKQASGRPQDLEDVELLEGLDDSD